MRDYWLTQYVLHAIGWGYVVLSLVGVALAIWLPKDRKAKFAVTLGFIGLASILPFRGYEEFMTERQAAAIDRKKLSKAQALFEERCKTAGEKIYKTVEGVEGILLPKIRQYSSNEGQMEPGAAAAHEFYGDDYIRSFLWWEGDSNDTGVRTLRQTPTVKRGYRYVETVDSSIGKRYRYSLDDSYKLQRKEWIGPTSRYAVTFEDVEDPSEREYWVAGSIVKIVDQANNEVLGEATRYVLEPGQGNRAGQRVPWLFAVACNRSTSYGSYGTRLFADQVLKPNQEISK